MVAGPKSGNWSSNTHQPAKKCRMPQLAARSTPQQEDVRGTCQGKGPPSACCHREVSFCRLQRGMEQIPNPRCGSAGSGYVLSLGYSESKWMVEQRVTTAQKSCGFQRFLARNMIWKCFFLCTVTNQHSHLSYVFIESSFTLHMDTSQSWNI